MKNRFKISIGVVAAMGVIILFQNCAKTEFASVPGVNGSLSLDEDQSGVQDDFSGPSDDPSFESEFPSGGSETPSTETPTTPTPPVVEEDKGEYLCQVKFQTAGTAGTKVKSEAECLKYYDELKRKNPQYHIEKVTLDGKVLLEQKEVSYTCSVTLQGAGTAGTKVKSDAECMRYYDELKRNNPSYTISKVTIDGRVLYELAKPKTYSCAVTFQGKGTSTGSVANESACMAYYAELKKNNPKLVISKVLYNGSKVLYQK